MARPSIPTPKVVPKILMRNYQASILRDFLFPGFRGALTGARGCGKDFTATNCGYTLAMLKPGASIGYLAPTLKNLKKILFTSDDKTGKPMFQSVIDKDTLIPTKSGDWVHKDLTNIKFKNGSSIYLIGSDQNSELGTSLDALIISESARIPRESWKYVIGNVMRANGRILEVSTPYFSSDFNDLIDGLLPESKAYKMYRYPADKLFNPDGSRIYTEEMLQTVAMMYDEVTLGQEYYVRTDVINQLSVLGNSLKKATRDMFLTNQLGMFRRIYFSFDLGQADRTVMYVFYEDSFFTEPVLIHRMSKSQTNLEEFVKKMVQIATFYNASGVDVILPFDADYDIQGYSSKLNRREEIRKAVPKSWRINLVTRTTNIRAIEITRRVLETGKLHIANNEDGEMAIKELSSVEYKYDKVRGKILMEIEKRSGINEDHCVHALKYFVVWKFKDMFEEDYDTKINTSILNGYNPRLTSVAPINNTTKTINRGLFNKLNQKGAFRSNFNNF